MATADRERLQNLGEIVPISIDSLRIEDSPELNCRECKARLGWYKQGDCWVCYSRRDFKRDCGVYPIENKHYTGTSGS